MKTIVAAQGTTGTIDTAAIPYEEATVTISGGNSTFTLVETADLGNATPPTLSGNRALTARGAAQPQTATIDGVGVHANPTWPKGNIRAGWNRSHDAQNTQWSRTHLAANTFDWRGMDTWMRYCRDNGMTPVHTIVGTPNFISARPAEGGPYGLGSKAEPSSYTPLGDYVTALCQRYTDLQFIEVWNEPQSTNFLTTTPQTSRAAVIAQMLRTVNQAAKAVRSSIKIISPGNDAAVSNGATFLGQVLTASDGAVGTGKDWIDYVGVHLYPDGGMSGFSRRISEMVTATNNAQTSNGLATPKPIWNTEFALQQSVYPWFIGGLPRPVAVRVMKAMFGSAVAAGVQWNAWYSMASALGGNGLQGVDFFRSVWEEVMDWLLGSTFTGLNVSAAGDVIVIRNGLQEML